MVRKGLNADEKKKKLEELFHETRDFYNLKEVEKLGPQMKGVVAQSVKGVLEELISESLVCTDKIGLSTYYWSFPSTALKVKRARVEELESQLADLTSKNESLTSAVERESVGRDESEERTELLSRLEEARKLRVEYKKELEQYKENDPVMLQRKLDLAQEAKGHANRWTDNVFLLQSYAYNKFNCDKSDFFRQFGIPESFDEIE
ncbi:tripartite motif-containing 2 [Ramicandelaber brevisporus]|nr:tripartite motif-containing 2 [Ramicandelaber brevisporus]